MQNRNFLLIMLEIVPACPTFINIIPFNNRVKNDLSSMRMRGQTFFLCVKICIYF